MKKISGNLEAVNRNIERACAKVGRKPDEIELIAVSKTFPTDVILQAYEAGIRKFGENRAIEFRDKVPLLPGDIEWHFIGHLQTNKIKYVGSRAHLIHSVDSLHLAKALSEYGQKNHIEFRVLMEVNTSGEESKYGIHLHEAQNTFLQIDRLQNIHLKGLMTIGPFTENVEAIRKAFRALKQIQQDLKTEVDNQKLKVLSMGMSHDYLIAIEEGSTMVRIGTAIFGSRGR